MCDATLITAYSDRAEEGPWNHKCNVEDTILVSLPHEWHECDCGLRWK